MMKYIASLLFTISLVNCALLGYKQHVTEEAVVTRPLTINVKLFNVGESSVHDIVVSDVWPADSFTVLSGSADFKVDKIAAGANVTHTYVVVPKNTGTFTSGAAKIVYRPHQKANTGIQTSFTNAIGEFDIESVYTYERRHSTHAFEWTVFLALCLASVGPASFVWWGIQTNYEHGIKKVVKTKST